VEVDDLRVDAINCAFIVQSRQGAVLNAFDKALKIQLKYPEQKDAGQTIV
jgi:hypothetical protein